MSTPVLIALIVIAVAIIVAGLVLALRTKRTERLRDRFGPEYHRVIEHTGSKTEAEAKLEKLEERVERYHIHSLPAEERVRFIEQWRSVQSRFVDNPRLALAEADSLIQKIMSARGYPMTRFEERAADISVDHPQVVARYRAGHEIALRHAQGRASTEDLRVAMIHYRTLFDELAETEPVHSKTAKA